MYLDTNTLLDILASVEEGFSLVERITSTSTDLRSAKQAVKGDFGIGLWNLFKIKLKGGADRTTGQQTGEDHSTERYHTYGSLMNKLKSNLENEGLLTTVDSNESWESVKPSDFVEIRGKFVRVPLHESLESLIKYIEYWLVLQRFQSSNPNLTGQNQTKNLFAQSPELKNMYFQMKVMLGDFEPTGSRSYIVEPTKLPEHKVLVKLFSEYIRDRTGRELPYSEFKVLGKVTRKISEGDSINLIHGSTFSLIGDEPATQFLKVFEAIGKSGIKIPKEVSSKIDGPAMQVIPIAIYV